MFVCLFLSFFLSFFLCPFFPRQISAVADWMSTIYAWCGPSANLECMSEMCCTRLAGNAGPPKSSKYLPSGHHRTNLSGYIFATKAHIDNRKNMLIINVSPTCPRNLVNLGPLAAEIFWRVWGTPANFNSFSVLAALLHGSRVYSGHRPKFAALNRGRHLHAAGRPSRWPTF